MDDADNRVTAPGPREDWALFLDIDGTLLDIAQKPGAVTVPPALVPTLEAVSARLGGALGIVSGRQLSDIDRFFSPLMLPCAAEHGAIVRTSDGTLSLPETHCSVPADWRKRILEAARKWPGVLIQEKSFSLSVHYRLAPEYEEDIRRLVDAVVAQDPQFEALPARMAFEIRHRSLHKGRAVRELMRSAPFKGRVPVFVGDDVTDQDGFHAARNMGGIGLNVDETFGGKPANVRNWLKSFVSQPGT
jgi:trehalose 6-phosphate phosphatase